MKCSDILSISTAAVALLASAASFAQPQGEALNAPEFTRSAPAATVSRASVGADLSQARRDGMLAWGEAGYGDDAVEQPRVAGMQTRDQARSDAREARRLGLIAPGEAVQQLSSAPARTGALQAAARSR